MKSKEMQAEKTFIRLTEIKIKLREMVRKKKSMKWSTQQNQTVLKTTEEKKTPKCMITELFPLSI